MELVKAMVIDLQTQTATTKKKAIKFGFIGEHGIITRRPGGGHMFIPPDFGVPFNYMSTPVIIWIPDLLYDLKVTILDPSTKQFKEVCHMPCKTCGYSGRVKAHDYKFRRVVLRDITTCMLYKEYLCQDCNVYFQGIDPDVLKQSRRLQKAPQHKISTTRLLVKVRTISI
jgi:hypothetical protein